MNIKHCPALVRDACLAFFAGAAVGSFVALIVTLANIT